MLKGSLKSAIQVNLSNIPGWRTERNIVVIESDDWGSVYMPDRKAFDALTNEGVPLSSHYLNNDTLESNKDMEMLFNLLSKYKDSTGRSVVMTGVNVVANPDFEKIKANGFNKYEYELFPETAKRYPASNNIYNLWKQGINERLIVPVFHGREHINVQRWMKLLQEGNETVKLAFNYGVATLDEDKEGNRLPDTRAAFDIDALDDLPYLSEVIKTGMDEFEKLFGYKSTFFIPTNGPFNNSLEEDTAREGIKYIGTGKIQHEPMGNGSYKKNVRYLGKRNQHGQIYLTRNCFFEPCSWEMHHKRDWVSYCMREIAIAFKWKKPAVISSHRVNYMGTLNPDNRKEGLKELGVLLSSILKKWPKTEFMTSMELGDLITKGKLN